MAEKDRLVEERSHLIPVPDPEGGEPLKIVGKITGTALYRGSDGLFYRKEGNKGYVPVENLEKVKVLRVIGVEGGEEGRRIFYEIGVKDKTVLCSREGLLSGAVWEEFVGVAALGSAGRAGVSNLANVVDFWATRAPKVSGHPSTGWQHCTAGGKGFFGYVLPNGSVLGSGGRRDRVHTVGFPEAARDAYDGLEGSPRADEREVREALDFVRGLTPERGQALLALGTAARSLAFGVERAGVSVVVEGASGTGKSSIAGLARSLVAPYSYPPKPDLTFSDTVTRMEVALDKLGSMPVLIDDLALPPGASPKDVRDAQTKLERIIRPLYNDAPMRQRMRRDMKEQRSYKAGTIPVFTTEGLPQVLNSLLRRSLLIALEEGEADLQLIRDSAQHANALRTLGVGIVEHLSERIENAGLEGAAREIAARREAYAERLRELLEERLGRPVPQVCESLPTNAAEVLVGLFLLGEAGPDGGGGRLVKDGAEYVVGMLEEQVLRMEGKDGEDEGGPFARLMREFSAYVGSGSALPDLGGKSGRVGTYEPGFGFSDEAPKTDLPAGTWGVPASDNEKLITLAHADPLAGSLYLDATGRRILRALAERTPGCEHIATDKTMVKAAENEGWIKRRGEGKHVAVKVGPLGQQRRVLALSLGLYLDKETEPEPEEPAPPETARKQEESFVVGVPELWEDRQEDLEPAFEEPPPEHGAEPEPEPKPAPERIAKLIRERPEWLKRELAMLGKGEIKLDLVAKHVATAALGDHERWKEALKPLLDALDEEEPA